MKRLNDCRMRFTLIGFVAVIVVGAVNAKADFTFGEPINLGSPINSSSGESVDCISSDGLEMYLDSNRSGGYGGWDIWIATRETINDEWGVLMNPGPPINTGQHDVCAYLSSDELELYFHSTRPGGQGNDDIWVTRRITKDDPWSQATNLGPIVNSSAVDCCPGVSPNGLELYFNSNRPGGHGHFDIWISRRATRNDQWEEPKNLGPIVNSSACEIALSLSSDGLVLLFSEDKNSPMRPGGYGNADMWMSRRITIFDPWGEPVNLGPQVNGSYADVQPRISSDGSMLYFGSERSGGFGGAYGDIYQAPIIPIVDLNGDGIVNAADMCIMIDHWGENYSLCDIGPMPWGDGIVDVEDLKVLTEHFFKEVDDPTLIAHWALDEAQGDIAYDDATDCDGVLIGDPVWQPDGGIVAGALQLDGIDDYVSTAPVLNPEDGKFSAVVWIQGGAPGQVVISQEGGADWLLTGAEGNLISELRGSGRNGSPILSQTNIADGNWHRIGIVWDGSNRTLYVDGVAVAQDTQKDLGGSDNGLHIGCGHNIEAGTFWSGLIDDVRIYNRAIKP